MVHNQLTKFNWLPLYPENIEIGEYSDIGAFTLLQGQYGIRIGKYAQIGGGCCIYSYDSERGKRGPVVIGDYALIGAGCVILPGGYN